MKLKTILFLLLGTLVFAQENIEFSGYGATGFIIYNRNRLRKFNQEVYYEGKLQADVKINKDIEAQVDMRGSSEDGKVSFREFSAKFEYWKHMKIKVGNIKKPFGLEQLVNKEELISIDRSYIQRTISDLGYGGRSVSVMAYYNYKKKDPEFPFSYFLSVMKDNSQNNGIAGRFSYHNNDFIYSANYMYLNKGGEVPFNSHAFSADAGIETDDYSLNLELLYVQDPIEGIRRKQIGVDDKIFSSGVKINSSIAFKIGGEVIKKIEPSLLLGFFAPNSKEMKYHTLEAMGGVNVYFDKDARLRLFGDGLFTKNIYNNDYTTIGSRFILEMQVFF